MKRLIIKIVFIILTANFVSCGYPDVKQKHLKADDKDLPQELKGLKVYTIRLENLDYIKVAVLNNKINSTTYSKDKTQESLVIVDNSTGKLIKVSQILSENDSLIVCKK